MHYIIQALSAPIYAKKIPFFSVLYFCMPNNPFHDTYSVSFYK